MAKPAITMSMLALLVAALLAQSTPGSARALLQDCKATMEVSTVEALTTAVGCANTGTTTEIDIIKDLSAPDLEVYELSSSVEVRGQVPGQWGQNGIGQNGIDININGENVFSGGGGGGGAKLTNIAFVFNGTGASSAPPSFSLAAMTFNPMDNQTVVLGVGSGNLKISATSFDTITNATAVVVLDSMWLDTSSTSFDDCASPDAGGAMCFNSSGSFTLSSTSFTKVSSDAQGGALWLSTGGNATGGEFPIGPKWMYKKSTLSSTLFDSCTGTDGGAMYVAAGIMSFSSTGFRNCNAANDASSGGGMYLANGAAIKAFTSSSFESCTAAGAGGGMYVAGTVPISISVSFDGNSAAEGNNLAVSSEGTVTFTSPIACSGICESDTDCTGVTCPSNPFGP